jgi:hypothetical protein
MTGAMKIYKTFDEIKSDPKFKPDNPVDKTNYKSLVGHYTFPAGQEIQCCVRKPNGNPCDTKHRIGWVPALTDGTITVIGGTCARKKFGADSSVVRDIVAATKTINREIDLVRLKELLQGRDAKLQKVQAAYKTAQEVRGNLDAIRDELGEPAWRRLIGMSRTGNGTVSVTGVVDAKRDDKGRVIRDRESTNILVGRISNTEVCHPYRFANLIESLRKTAVALKIEEEAVANMKAKELKALLTTLEEQPRLLEDIKGLGTAVKGFLDNDFTPLAFTTTIDAEKVRIIQVAAKRRGRALGDGPARARLHDIEQNLRVRAKVERLQIAQ